MSKLLQSSFKQITNTKLLDILFIELPIWFPLIYIYLAINFQSISKFIFIGSLFLFAETHFASTWLFFFDKENKTWIKENFYRVVFLPIYTFLLIIFTWFFSPTLIIVAHYLASGWHVTKQSTGILKIYLNNTRKYEFMIYLISFLCIFIGLQRPGLLSDLFDKTAVNLTLGFSFLCYLIILFLNYKKILPTRIYNFMPVFTGLTIYLPILFFKDLATATAVGVGMHWCQYISIMWSSFLRKNKISKNPKFTSKLFLKRILFVFGYSFVMTSFVVMGSSKSSDGIIEYSFIYLIPLTFQLYHFYIDGFIWKFSDKHIRESVLQYLFKVV